MSLKFVGKMRDPGRLNVYGKEDMYYGNDYYEEVPDPEEWLECPKCNLKPIQWVVDNIRITCCGCEGEVGYGFHIGGVPIGQTAGKFGGLGRYNREELKDNWNYYCKTGKIREVKLPEPEYKNVVTKIRLDWMNPVSITSYSTDLDDLNPMDFDSLDGCSQKELENMKDSNLYLILESNVEGMEVEKFLYKEFKNIEFKHYIEIINDIQDNLKEILSEYVK